jgi:lysine-specific demethylase/histidyl-hydroxylase NO66
MKRCAKEKTLRYSADVNVVRFDEKQQRRLPFKTGGDLSAKELSRCMKQGWSVRFLRPHEHSDAVRRVVCALEHAFQCNCGVNSYWTPKNSQGFAPHYDDVDVFLLQLEGRKRWRLYNPPTEVDVLSRHSSEDYVADQLPEPIFTTELKAGDALYMPRGMVHQGDTCSGEHSLHITFSACQMHTYADLLKGILSYHVESLAAGNREWRKSIPIGWLDAMGLANSRAERQNMGLAPLAGGAAQLRSNLLESIRSLTREVERTLTSTSKGIDCGVDHYAVQVLERMQPPVSVTPCDPPREVRLSDRVRLRTPHAVHLALNFDDEVQVYHTGGNSVVCMERAIQYLRFDRDFAPAIDFLQCADAPVPVSALPMEGFEADDANANRLTLVEELRGAGVLEVV